MNIKPCPHSTSDWCLECASEQSEEIQRLHTLLDSFELSTRSTQDLPTLVNFLLKKYKNPFV